RATQPVIASARRALDRLAELGEPVDAGLRDAVRAVTGDDAGADLVRLLAPHLLLRFRVGPRGPLRAEQLLAPVPLLQSGWRSYLVCADNPDGIEPGSGSRAAAATPPRRAAWSPGPICRTGSSTRPRSATTGGTSCGWTAPAR